MCPSNICDYSWTGKKTKKNYEKGWKERKKTKNNNTKLFTHFCCKLSFCRDYALFGGPFLLKFGGEGYKNILYDRASETQSGYDEYSLLYSTRDFFSLLVPYSEILLLGRVASNGNESSNVSKLGVDNKPVSFLSII